MGDATSTEGPPRGAYGLRVHGVDAAEVLVEADPSWPSVHLEAAVSEVVDEPEELTEHSARLRLKTGGRVLVDRERGTALFEVPRRLEPIELVHPYLAPVASVMAYWLGRESFHAGALALGADVWGVVGDRLAGKSTLLASLAAAGHDIVCDDLLVLERHSLRAFAGPRSIDLRADAAEQLGVGSYIGVAGARQRWRVPLGPVSARLKMKGFVFVSWGDDLSLTDVSASRRIELLVRHRAVTVPPRDAAWLLDAAALPCLELHRPRDWDRGDDVARTLVSRLAG